MSGKQIVFAVVGTVAKVVVAAVVLMFVYRYSIVAYDYGYRLFGEKAVDEEPGRTVNITVSQEDTPEDIGIMLEEEGLLNDSWLFVVHEKLSESKYGIAPGSYELNTAMTVEEMLEHMIAVTEENASEE